MRNGFERALGCEAGAATLDWLLLSLAACLCSGLALSGGAARLLPDLPGLVAAAPVAEPGGADWQVTLYEVDSAPTAEPDRWAIDPPPER